MRQVPFTALSALDDVTRNGAKIDARQLYNACFQVLFSDTDAAGTVKIQASNDAPPNGAMTADFTPTHWGDITSATVTVTAGVPTAAFIRLPDLCFTWVRAVFTQTTPGTGTVTVLMNAQGF